jgi:DNA-damage-inducible protein D
MDIGYDGFVKKLEEKKSTTSEGHDYWHGRDIAEILAYSEWRNFSAVVERAKAACEGSKFSSKNHFVETNDMVQIGSGAQRERDDWFLTRYACYLIAMNGDSSKAEVSHAMTYFAGQTRRQEIQDAEQNEQRRLDLRIRIMDNNATLSKTAHDAGVQNFAFFHDAGYRGLYGMGLSELKGYKGLKPDDDLLDHSGPLELAANDLRITLAEERIRRNSVKGQQKAIHTHKTVGEEVRAVVTKDNGTKPENLPKEPSIKALVSKHKRQLKKAPAPRLSPPKE